MTTIWKSLSRRMMADSYARRKGMPNGHAATISDHSQVFRHLRDERGAKVARQPQPPPPAPGANYTNDALLPEARVQVKWDIGDDENDEEAETVWYVGPSLLRHRPYHRSPLSSVEAGGDADSRHARCETIECPSGTTLEFTPPPCLFAHRRAGERSWSFEGGHTRPYVGCVRLLVLLRVVQYDEMPEYGPQEADAQLVFVDDQQLIGSTMLHVQPLVTNPIHRCHHAATLSTWRADVKSGERLEWRFEEADESLDGDATDAERVEPDEPLADVLQRVRSEHGSDGHMTPQDEALCKVGRSACAEAGGSHAQGEPRSVSQCDHTRIRRSSIA